MTGDVEAVPAISLWQPWAGAVAAGLKLNETRSHTRLRCLVGQVVAIHAALKWTAEQRDALARLTFGHGVEFRARWPETLRNDFRPTLGAVVAVAEIDDAQEMTPDLVSGQSQLEIALGDWRPGRWAYQLGRVHRLPGPVPAVGRQGPFKIVHPVVAAAARALREGKPQAPAVVLAPEHRHILEHSLGLGYLQKKPYRNYFCAGPGGADRASCEALVALGLMETGHAINGGRDRYFFVTEAGAAAVGHALPKDRS